MKGQLDARGHYLPITKIIILLFLMNMSNLHVYKIKSVETFILYRHIYSDL